MSWIAALRSAVSVGRAKGMCYLIRARCRAKDGDGTDTAEASAARPSHAQPKVNRVRLPSGLTIAMRDAEQGRAGSAEPCGVDDDILARRHR